MARKIKIGSVVVVAIAAGLLAVWYFAPDGRTASQQILGNISEIQAAVNAKNVGDCMDHVSEDYSDRIHESKRALMRICLQGFRERGRFDCRITTLAPVIEGKTAHAELQVEFSIDYGGGEVNREGPFAVQTTWVREGNQWLMIKAEGYMNAQNAYEGYSL